MAEEIQKSSLTPIFAKAYWRVVTRLRYRDLPAFSKKRGHFEPEETNAFAARWAEELTREEAKEEIRQVYENCVSLLGWRRSRMDRSDRSLLCPQFRFFIEACQDPTDPRFLTVTRRLWVESSLRELPTHFDSVFSPQPNELVVPVEGFPERREILELLEDWEERLLGKLSEGASGDFFQLRLRSGFEMAVSLTQQEVIFSKTEIAGVKALAAAIAHDLKALGLQKQVGETFED